MHTKTKRWRWQRSAAAGSLGNHADTLNHTEVVRVRPHIHTLNANTPKRPMAREATWVANASDDDSCSSSCVLIEHAAMTPPLGVLFDGQLATDTFVTAHSQTWAKENRVRTAFSRSPAAESAPRR